MSNEKKFCCEEKKFCCEQIKKFSHEKLAPLYCANFDESCEFYGYSFGLRRIRYCPCCGTLLRSDPHIVSPESYQHSFCCWVMESNANDPGEDWFQIFYQAFTRRYFFAIATDGRYAYPDDTIFQEWDFQFCIYCGRKLPEPLLDLWLEIVKTEFGVERQAPLEKMLPLVPEEYQTDWWWKKRGL